MKGLLGSIQEVLSIVVQQWFYGSFQKSGVVIQTQNRRACIVKTATKRTPNLPGGGQKTGLGWRGGRFSLILVRDIWFLYMGVLFLGVSL